jgi:hypothetical protein
MPANILEFCFDLAEIFMKKRKLSMDILRKGRAFHGSTAERNAFPQDKSWKVQTFRGYTSESSLFLWKSQPNQNKIQKNYPQDNRGKSKLYVENSAEKPAVL